MDSESLTDSRDPDSQAAVEYLFARTFGWTAAEVGALTPDQIDLYLEQMLRADTEVTPRGQRVRRFKTIEELNEWERANV